MKYVVILGDGMADYPLEQFGGKTPLQLANKPYMDALAQNGCAGLVKTIPDGLPPGSDTANLGVLGYDPEVYYSGRSPFEAASMGVDLQPDDITFRCNFVTLSDAESYEQRVILDHSADEITTEEARILLEDVSRHFGTPAIRFYTGVSYRHLMVWQGSTMDWTLTPPHDILEQPISGYLPQGPLAGHITAMMKESVAFLENHPVNQKRKERGLRPANSIWIWGEGQKPQLSPFYDKYGLHGGVISAVDLIKGIGICAGLKVLEVEGATGTLNTNFAGKAQAALDVLKSGLDFVYIHMEAPDECGHRQEAENKIKAIELIDGQVVKAVKEGLDKFGEMYKIMVLPDHATPLILRTHTSDPVPFIIYDSTRKGKSGITGYDERSVKDTGLYIGEGYTLMDMFLSATGGNRNEADDLL